MCIQCTVQTYRTSTVYEVQFHTFICCLYFKNNMASMESLVSGMIVGVLYGLFSGQPLTIMGSTGEFCPILPCFPIFSRIGGGMLRTTLNRSPAMILMRCRIIVSYCQKPQGRDGNLTLRQKDIKR